MIFSWKTFLWEPRIRVSFCIPHQYISLIWNEISILKFINFSCSLRLCNHLTYSIFNLRNTMSRNMCCLLCPFVPHHALTSMHKHASSTNYCNWHYMGFLLTLIFLIKNISFREKYMSTQNSIQKQRPYMQWMKIGI